jgi:hypothetical protein
LKASLPVTSTPSARLAWYLLALYGGVQGLILWLIFAGPARFQAVLGMETVGYAVVGVLVASRRANNAIGWLLITVALVIGFESLSTVYAVTFSNPGSVAAAWFAQLAGVVWALLLAIFVPLLFPDGRLQSRRWRPVSWLGGVALALCIAGTAFEPGKMSLDGGLGSVQNPLGAGGAVSQLIGIVADAGTALAILTVVLAVASLALRFKAAGAKERQQLKWLLFVALIALGGLCISTIAVSLPGGWNNPLNGIGWFTFFVAIVFGVPAAIGIAILRHRLYDIDVVINRTLVYTALTVTLVAAYVGSVLAFRLIVTPLAGPSHLGVAGSTLAVAALFRPARGRIQTAVDQRFYRSRYDAALTLEGFSEQLRHELDLDAMAADLRAVVQDTMQPTHTSLWLRRV